MVLNGVGGAAVISSCIYTIRAVHRIVKRLVTCNDLHVLATHVHKHYCQRSKQK